MKKKLPVVIGIITAILVGAFLTVTNGLSEGAKVALDGIDLANTADGSYTGTYDFKRWTNTLVVNVENHRIIGVCVEEDVVGAELTDCADEVFQRVIEAQSTQVDAVSGATITSKAYLKAIENALTQPQEQ